MAFTGKRSEKHAGLADEVMGTLDPSIIQLRTESHILAGKHCLVGCIHNVATGLKLHGRHEN